MRDSRTVLRMLTQSLACGTILKAREPLEVGDESENSGKPLKAASAYISGSSCLPQSVPSGQSPLAAPKDTN